MIEKVAATALIVGLAFGLACGWMASGYFHRGATIKAAQAQAKAETASRKQEQAATVTSERVGEEARTRAQEKQDKVKDDAQKSITVIKREYVPAACPDPVPIPDSVQSAIRKAESALASSR